MSHQIYRELHGEREVEVILIDWPSELDPPSVYRMMNDDVIIRSVCRCITTIEIAPGVGGKVKITVRYLDEESEVIVEVGEE